MRKRTPLPFGCHRFITETMNQLPWRSRNAVLDWIRAAELGINPAVYMQNDEYMLALGYWRMRLDRMIDAMLTAFPQTMQRVRGFLYRMAWSVDQFKRIFSQWFLGKHRLSAHITIQSSRGLTSLKQRLGSFMQGRDAADSTTYQMPWMEKTTSEDDSF